jgi:hypothetical protein
MCVVQLEAAYVFINLCKATLRNKPFRVKLEPPDEETIIDDIIPPVTLKKFQQIDEPMEQQTRFDTLFIASDYPVDVKLEPIDNKYEEDFLTKSKTVRDPIEDPDCKYIIQATNLLRLFFLDVSLIFIFQIHQTCMR